MCEFSVFSCAMSLLDHAADVKRILNNSYPDGVDLENNVENWRNTVLYYLQADQQQLQKAYLEDMERALCYVRLMVQGEEISDRDHGQLRAPLPGWPALGRPFHPNEELMRSEMRQCVSFLLRCKHLHRHWQWLLFDMVHFLVN